MDTLLLWWNKSRIPKDPERAVTTVLSPSTVMDIYDSDSNHLIVLRRFPCRGAKIQLHIWLECLRLM